MLPKYETEIRFHTLGSRFIESSPSAETNDTYPAPLQSLTSVFGLTRVFQVDLRHFDEVEGSDLVPQGVDLSEFYMSVEWDILDVPAVR